MKFSLVLLCLSLSLFVGIEGHAILLNPVGRSSRWRTNSSAPYNYDDFSNNCGGIGAQWDKNGGRCGLCGDNYSEKQPRPNELGGRYGEGIIVANYQTERAIEITLQVSANHLGYNFFEICNLALHQKESEECFSQSRLLTANGDDRHFLGRAMGVIKVQVVLPTDLSCEHCVLRWTYRGGNNWGICEDGRGSLGCGPQEHFRQCADISIPAGELSTAQPPETPTEV